jgi:SAM-dependent methyltransferase
MNEGHLELCSSDRWKTYLGTAVIPWALEQVTLGENVLEIGPGPGAATEELRGMVPSLTAVEYDRDLADALAERFRDDPMVRVLRPGGTFFGVDSLGGPSFLAFHENDVCVPLDPWTLADRLERAGFVDVDIAVRGEGVRWVAHTPEADGARARLNEQWLDLYEGDELDRLFTVDLVSQLRELAELGGDPLLLDAGPGPAIGPLRSAAPRLTVAQMDPAFTASVAAEWADDPEVTVTGVDPTDLPFPADRFSSAVVVLSLVLLRSTRAQDRTLAELARVLRPGAPLLGFNAIDGSYYRRLNAGDKAVPIDPMTFPDRLERAGFRDVRSDLWLFPRFIGRAPRSS